MTNGINQPSKFRAICIPSVFYTRSVIRNFFQNFSNQFQNNFYCHFWYTRRLWKKKKSENYIFQIIVFKCNLHALMELSKLNSQAWNAADIWPKVWGHFRLGRNSLLQRKLLLRRWLLYLKAKREEWKTFDHFLGPDFFPPAMFWHHKYSELLW